MGTGTASLSKLAQEIVAQGWNRKATWHVLGELLLNLVAALGGIWVFLTYQHPLVRICAMIVSTAGSMGVLTNTHTSSHYATSNRRWINELLTFLGYPLFMGVSACYWWHKHIVLHHPAPNVVGFDSDLDLSPWFARTSDEVQRSSGWRRFYYEKLQFISFPFSLGFVVFNMQIAGWRTLVRSLRDPGGNKKKEWIDVAAVLSHYLVWIVIPLAFFAPLHVLGFYMLSVGLIGYAMFAVLAPAHFPSEAVCLKDHGERDRLLLQTAATVNFSTGFIGRLVCSGLEYQIEHHLFPGISHVHYPKMAPLVREFCRTEGLPYRCYRWEVVLWKCLRTFHSPPKTQTDLEDFRPCGDRRNVQTRVRDGKPRADLNLPPAIR